MQVVFLEGPDKGTTADVFLPDARELIAAGKARPFLPSDKMNFGESQVDQVAAHLAEKAISNQQTIIVPIPVNEMGEMEDASRRPTKPIKRRRKN